MVYDTTRFVTGVDGAFSNGWRFEAYVNYGQTESEFTNFDRLQKEFYESIDAWRDPSTNQIVAGWSVVVGVVMSCLQVAG